MIRKNLSTLIITSLIILLPIAAGLILWDSLPEQIATHWNAQGAADGYSSKAGAVFTLPLVILGVHWLSILVTAADPKRASGKALLMVFWICPVLSVLIGCVIFATALGAQLPVEKIVPLFLGAMFLVLGNYLPKCEQNYTIGIKVPWALNDAENWNKTHRFAGFVWVIGGLLVIATSFLGSQILLFGILLVMSLAPVLYSYCYYKKHQN